VSDLNKRRYEQKGVVKHYAGVEAGLSPIEDLCLSHPAVPGQGAVLDIGIGAGRTTGPLKARFSDYVGVDYSAPLVEAARQRFPGADLQVMDARSLPFKARFSLAMFSYNGIDYIDPADRPQVFSAVFDALLPGGAFVYSTHNLAYRRVKAWTSRLLVKEALWPVRHLRSLPARLRNFRQQVLRPDLGYGLINDPGLGFGLLTAYVDIDREIEHLTQAGFAVQAVYGSDSAAPGHGPGDSWAYLVASKPPA
jgi:hypothetical protein